MWCMQCIQCNVCIAMNVMYWMSEITIKLSKAIAAGRNHAIFFIKDKDNDQRANKTEIKPQIFDRKYQCTRIYNMATYFMFLHFSIVLVFPSSYWFWWGVKSTHSVSCHRKSSAYRQGLLHTWVMLQAGLRGLAIMWGYKACCRNQIYEKGDLTYKQMW